MFESNQLNNKLDAVEIEIWMKILKLISAIPNENILLHCVMEANLER